jgi:type I site-specific restriction endonuclease
MNEADTRANMIEPQLRAAGWTDRGVTREFYYQRDREYAPGRVVLVGNETRRSTPRRLDRFSRPEELWQRWVQNTGLSAPTRFQVGEERAAYLGQLRERTVNPLLYGYCPESLRGKRPHYFQEAAVREVLTRLRRGQRRVLLAMATGTGKTFVAFQIVWKLVKSGWLGRGHPDRPARVLFLADRVVLRDQAYNAFSPFVDGTSDPRHKVGGYPPNLNRDLYFGIYQSLWSPDETGVRLFEHFPHDFFDLVIIDECHRSGFGTWRAPAYEYSLGRGIEDGFLATYEVHRVRTTVDAAGLRLEDAVEQGAEVFVPADVDPRPVYTTPQFEREITLPDRTQAMARHLAGLLRRFGPTGKTMVFCVDMEHARLVARLLQNELGTELGIDEYAVPIISEEGEDGRRQLEAFADSDSLPPGTFAPYSDVKAALLFFARPGPTKEIWYYELPLPEGLKKFSKGSPIQDEHFAADEIVKRGYDLTARNPSRPGGEELPTPVEIVDGLLEKEREILGLIEELDETLGNQGGENSAASAG